MKACNDEQKHIRERNMKRIFAQHIFQKAIQLVYECYRIFISGCFYFPYSPSFGVDLISRVIFNVKRIHFYVQCNFCIELKCNSAKLLTTNKTKQKRILTLSDPCDLHYIFFSQVAVEPVPCMIFFFLIKSDFTGAG